MSFFTHMTTDQHADNEQEQLSWAPYTVSKTQKFFIAENNDATEQNELTSLDKQGILQSGQNNIKVEQPISSIDFSNLTAVPVPKRKFFSLFPSPKRDSPKNNTSDSLVEMPPPPPKIPASKDTKVPHHQPQPDNKNETSVVTDRNSTDAVRSIGTEIISPAEDMVLGTVTRTESWQEVTCIRAAETEDFQFCIKDKKIRTGTHAKRKLFWEAKEQGIKDGLKAIRNIKNSVIQMEKSDIENITSLEDLKSQLLKENIASLEHEIDSLHSNCKETATKIERLSRCLEKVTADPAFHSH